MKIELSEKQFKLIWEATEMLWRHLIGQTSFIPYHLEEWSLENKEESEKIGKILLDIWKVIMYETAWDKSNSWACVHNYDVMKMGQENLIYVLSCK